MAKQPAKRQNPTPKKTPPAPKKPDYDAGLRSQLEPYGLTMADVVAVLEEDPKNLQYIEPGAAGKALANAAMTVRGSCGGNCGRGVYNIHKAARERSSSVVPTTCGHGKDIYNNCENTGAYIQVTYHAGEVREASLYAPNGTTFSWGSADIPGERNPNSYKGTFYGHTAVKGDDNHFPSDGAMTLDGVERTVLHGKGGSVYYGSVMHMEIPKDCTLSPVLLERAVQKKKEREALSVIPSVVNTPTPTIISVNNFLTQNPRLGYLLLKKFDPTISESLAQDGGKKILDYYNKLPANDPKKVALNVLVDKKIKNTKDYKNVNKTLDDIYLQVMQYGGQTQVYERLRQPSADELSNLTIRTPYYAEMLLKKMNVKYPDISTSDKLDKYIKDLAAKKTKGTLSRDEASAYEAINLLAKKGLTPNDNEDKVNHEIASIAKNYRTATKAERDNMFDSTPFYVTLLQRELGTTWKGDHELTSQEFKDYYDGKVIGQEPNTKKITPAEKRAIDSLAMEGLTKDSTNVLAVIHDIAERYKGDVQKELSASMKKEASLANTKKTKTSNLYAKNDKEKDLPAEDKARAEKGTIDMTQLLQQGRDMC